MTIRRFTIIISKVLPTAGDYRKHDQQEGAGSHGDCSGKNRATSHTGYREINVDNLPGDKSKMTF